MSAPQTRPPKRDHPFETAAEQERKAAEHWGKVRALQSVGLSLAEAQRRVREGGAR